MWLPKSATSAVFISGQLCPVSLRYAAPQIRNGCGFHVRAALSRVFFAECLSKDVKTIKNWETGKVIPSAESLNELCKLFSCDFGYLLCEYSCKTREFTDIQAVTGLSERAIEHIKHNGEKKFKDGYFDLSHGVQKKLLNAFLESPEFASVMLQLRLYYALTTTANNTQDSVEFTAADLHKAECVAESVGSIIIDKGAAAESYLSVAAEYFKQFARKAAEQRSVE